MKTFFDRISDCLKTEKQSGKKLRGKEMVVISSGSDTEVKNGFYMQFKDSAKYLGISYIDDVHCRIENGAIPEDVLNKLDVFIKSVR